MLKFKDIADDPEARLRERFSLRWGRRCSEEGSEIRLPSCVDSLRRVIDPRTGIYTAPVVQPVSRRRPGFDVHRIPGRTGKKYAYAYLRLV